MADLKSHSLQHVYTSWVDEMLQANRLMALQFVDSVYELCERHYDKGGDTVVETMTPEEVHAGFNSLKDVHEYSGLMVDKSNNCRYGDTDDDIKEVWEYES
jgi:hypothetical protein